MLHGIKYTKERLEYLGIKVSAPNDGGVYVLSLIVESGDGGYFMRYNIHNNGIFYTTVDELLVDTAVDRFIVQLRKEKLQKLQKLNEVQAQSR